jgi:hypothetical protein
MAAINHHTTLMELGIHGPVIMPDGLENSFLAKKMIGSLSIGEIMPLAGLLPED